MRRRAGGLGERSRSRPRARPLRRRPSRTHPSQPRRAVVTAAKRPSWWRCTESADPRFTVGVAYEVFEYGQDGRPLVMTDGHKAAKLPVEKANFEPHDPWARHRLEAQANPTNGGK